MLRITVPPARVTVNISVTRLPPPVRSVSRPAVLRTTFRRCFRWLRIAGIVCAVLAGLILFALITTWLTPYLMA